MSRLPSLAGVRVKYMQQVAWSFTRNGTGVTNHDATLPAAVDPAKSVVVATGEMDGYYSAGSNNFYGAAGAYLLDGSTVRLGMQVIYYGGGGPWQMRYHAAVIQFEAAPKLLVNVQGNDAPSQTHTDLLDLNKILFSPAFWHPYDGGPGESKHLTIGQVTDNWVDGNNAAENCPSVFRWSYVLP